jgi:hypothetical protein
MDDATVAEPEAAQVNEKPKRARKQKRRPNRVGRKRGAARPFPAAAFEEALGYARELFAFGSGQPVRRLTLSSTIWARRPTAALVGC